MNTIHIRSRYGEIHELKRIGENSHLFSFKPYDSYYRLGVNNDNTISFIDPSGGPYITIGSHIKGAGVVKSISKDNNNIILEFE